MTGTTDVVVQLEGVDKSFGGQKVLDNVDLQVEAGTTTVIVGGSGQGKSVILKHMLGLVTPDQGTVRVLGQDLTRINKRQLKELRTNFGVLFQNGALFDSLTVFENVALPLRERTRMSESEIHKVTMERLELLDLPHAGQKFPAQLSGGMQKRVGLARALVMEPKIVFFDEPTTGLDVSMSNDIYRLFHRSQQTLGYAAVMVSHDVPKIFKLADRVALLANGQIQGCMSPESFQLSSNPLIHSFVLETMGPIYTSEQEEALFDEKV